MKKYVASILIVFVFTFGLSATDKTTGRMHTSNVHKGNFIISHGYGFPSIIRVYLKNKTDQNQLSVKGKGPFLLKVEYMISNKLSVGVNAAYNSTQLSWMDDGYDPAILGNRPYEYGIKATEFSGTIRGNYHFKITKKFDWYAGIGFGYAKIKLQTYTLAPYNQFSVRYSFPRPYTFDITAGSRFFLTKHIGMFAEVGVGKAWLLFNKYFVPEAVIQGGFIIKL
jgi:opacity protein-like surface antigen